jgi:hypothetical protein
MAIEMIGQSESQSVYNADNNKGMETEEQQEQQEQANASGSVEDGGEADSDFNNRTGSKNKSNNHSNGGNTYSDVNSEAYEEDNEEEEEDDDTFIERLSNMVDLADLLDNEGSVESEERESVEDSTGLNVCRSRHTIRAPKRLIEEMGGISVDDDGKTTWKDCLMEVYEFTYQDMTMGKMALVGAGIGGGFGHTSELYVKKYNEALRSNDLDELAKILI